MSQLTFAEVEYEGKKRKTRREKFLERMDGLIPWKKLEQQLAKKYSNGYCQINWRPLIESVHEYLQAAPISA
jgi:hypothetical protein